MASARLRAGGRLGGVVLGDGPAQRCRAVHVERAERRFEVVAADVVEVDVDAVRGRCLELLGHGPALVVERGVEAVLLGEQPDLVVRAGAADGPLGALEPGDLSDLAADRTGRSGDEDGVALWNSATRSRPA
jgi:hypothetical protein